MAPEQQEGREVTTRTDVYALGLVLYEMFTGKPALTVDGALLGGRAQNGAPPASPSTHIPDLDPAIERVILRCLERDPARRPAIGDRCRGGVARREPARGDAGRRRNTVTRPGCGGWRSRHALAGDRRPLFCGRADRSDPPRAAHARRQPDRVDEDRARPAGAHRACAHRAAKSGLRGSGSR